MRHTSSSRRARWGLGLAPWLLALAAAQGTLPALTASPIAPAAPGAAVAPAPGPVTPIATEPLEVLGVAETAGLFAVRAVGGSIVKLYDAGSGRLVREVRLQSEVLLSVPPAITPDGRWLAVALTPDPATREGRLGLFSTTDPVYGFFLRSAGLRDSVSLAISPDGTRLAVGNRNNYVQLWNLSTRQRMNTLKAATEPRALTFSPDGRYFMPQFRGQKTTQLLLAAGGEPARSLPVTGGQFAVADLLVAGPGRALSLSTGAAVPLPAYLAGGATLHGFDRGARRALVTVPGTEQGVVFLELRDVLSGASLARQAVPALFALSPRLMPGGNHALIGDGAGGLRLLTLR